MLSQDFKVYIQKDLKIILRLFQDYFKIISRLFLEYFRCNDFKILLDPEKIYRKYFLYPEDFQKVFQDYFKIILDATILKFY